MMLDKANDRSKSSQRRSDRSSDRRISSRFVIDKPATLSFFDREQKVKVLLSCTLKTLSSDGISVEGDNLPPIKTNVELRFLGSSELAGLLFNGKSVWIEGAKNSLSRSVIGITLSTPIDSETMRLLSGESANLQPQIDRRQLERRSGHSVAVDVEKRSFDRRSRSKLLERAHKWARRLNEWREQGTYFYLKTMESGTAPRVRVGNKEVIMLASNNYLGLANHPEVIDATVKAVKEFGTASGAARLLTGTTVLHAKLEESIAEFKGSEAAVVYSSGYLANLGAISTLTQAEDVIFIDDKVHASIVDGARFSGARIRVFRHNDEKALDRKLLQHKSNARKLVIVDGIYSMDGDIANLPDIHKVALKHNAMLMVDDAHATGVIGATGRGTEEHFGIKGAVDVTVGTFSKSLACAGGFVCGSKELVSFLKHFSRAFIFNTSLPPAVCASAIAAIGVLKRHPEIVEQLNSKSRYFVDGLRSIGFKTGLSQTPIIPIMIGHERKMNEVMGYLLHRGVMVSPVGRPAVKRNSSRLRVNVMATHTSEDLDRALGEFQSAYKRFGPFQTDANEP